MILLGAFQFLGKLWHNDMISVIPFLEACNEQMTPSPLVPHGRLVAHQHKLCGIFQPHGDGRAIAYFHSFASPNSDFHYNLDAHGHFHPHAYPFSKANDYTYTLPDAKSFSHLHSDGGPHACGRKDLSLTHEP